MENEGAQLVDWVAGARLALASNKPAVRTACLTEELLPLAKKPALEQAQIQDILRLLLFTVPRYADAASRQAVLAVLAALLAREHDTPVAASNGSGEANGSAGGKAVSSVMIKWLVNEVDRLDKSGTVAPATRYNLFSWGATIFSSLPRGPAPLEGAQGAALVAAISTTVFALLDETATLRATVRTSVLYHARRIVRENYTAIPLLINTLTSATATPSFRHAPFLGIVLDVALHLKAIHGRQVAGQGFVQASKDTVNAYYLANVVSAKIPPPRLVEAAFAGFFAATVLASDVETVFVPTFEKVLPKSPEVALPVLANFVTLLPISVQPSTTLRLKLLPAILPHAKSLVPGIRTASSDLFTVLFGARDLAAEDVASAASQVYIPLKTGKTSSPDHRTTLFTMLASIPASFTLSAELVGVTIALLPKESNEAAILAMMRVLTIHLPTSLAAGSALTPIQISALVKGMQEPKPATRRALFFAMGNVLWSLDVDATKVEDATVAFGVGLLAGLESALKTVTSNPLNSPAGPLEGYVAVATLKSRLGRWGNKKIDDFITASPTMQTILATGAKPSFLLWDKVYRKVTSADEELWLTYALEALIVSDEDKLNKDLALRTAVAHGIIHLALESSHFQTRANILELVRKTNTRVPKLLHLILKDGARSYLLQMEKAKVAAKPVSEDAPTPADRAPRLCQIFRAMTVFDESTPVDLVEQLLSELLVLAHHPRLGEKEAGLWVDLVRNAKVGAEALVQSRLPTLMGSLWVDASTNPSSVQFAQAAYAAATTLAFVAPAVVVPHLFAQLEDDLSVDHLAFIGQQEYGIWATPEGIAFVDVLAAQKPKVAQSQKNSKEREIEIWEAELRKALARKKPVVAALSKPDRLLVERQLVKESGIRKAVAEALGRIRRGFALLLCLVDSKAELVQEYLATMVSLALKVIVLRPATLVAPEAFATYQSLGQICSDRLGVSKVALGVSVLRSVEANVVPEDFTTEPVAGLVTRILYRLRYLADQAPFDAGTFAYASPLVSRVIRSGGIGLEKSDAEAALEQLTLALDFIAFHARQCSETAFPRLLMIGDLLATLASYPTLSRTATSALADIAEAMKATATMEEIECLLGGAMTEEVYIRFACLQALQPLDLTEFEFPANLWIACHDIDERNSELANGAWEENGLDVPESFLPHLLPFLAHSSNAIRQAAAKSIAAGIDAHPVQVADAIAHLIEEYRLKVKELQPMYDQFGMIIEASLTVEDPWRTRVAVGTTLKLISQHFSPADVDAFFDLLISGEALGDRSQAVRSEMLDAAIVVIDIHGKETLQSLIATFEEYLGRPTTGDVVQDHCTEALVILFGRLARHLDPTDPRIATVIGRLIEALKTPSEVVQAAVCDCLPPLIRVIKADVPPLVDQLLTSLFTSPKYAERRGAAYGLAGIVRGRGVSSLKEFGILGQLRDNAEDKKNMHARQGAIFGYEVLSTVIGRLFEPYIIEVLPILLASFGDASTDVREATQDAAKSIMGKLSGHAVKLILPTLLTGLDDKQWRAKKGAIELMGAMAFLAPKQLSISLPTIIPRLAEVLTDTHKQVRESANVSLKRFGDVIATPEIQAMQSVLLDALVDPSRKTPKALDALLATTFAHFIDSSSLALVIPILDRGLRERSADVKRKASAIVGNMATLTEAKDLIPYLSQLVPLIRGVLIDPVPEARSTAAKSLGALVERLGENNFPGLMDTLMAVLESPSSGVDQQGAAQGVSEILAGLGTDRLESLLPSILASTRSPRAYVREGHISLLIFLPATFGDRFSPYLGRIIQPVLSGLADESDYVREASMRAGRMIVANHSTKAIDLLLPQLELGLFDESWRIRQSSVQLVGELLFHITGVSGKPDEDDDGDEDADDTRISTDTKKVLTDILGKDRLATVLAAVYIVRQDGTGGVRQAAIHVWKSIISNTPRTVRELLPVLMQIIVRTLASPGIEQRETAARCLADTCRKLGETVLGEVISNLQKAMATPDRRQREGVCLALTEIMAHTNKASLEAHEGMVINIVRGALVDSDPIVRSAAAHAFDVAQTAIGARSLDETIPTLLDALQVPGEAADAALAALKEVMQVRAEKIFPVLIPRLIATPITAFNARALELLVPVAGSALGKRITSIVDALYAALKIEKDEATIAQLELAFDAVLASVLDHDSGLSGVNMHALAMSKAESPEKRITGCAIFARFCRVAKCDFSDFTIDWIRQLVSLFDDRDAGVVGAAWLSLDALVKTIDKEDMEALVVPLRRTIEGVGTVGIHVDGFSRPNGLKPILPILLQGLLAGTGEQREQAAYAIGDLVERTDPQAFKSYCIQTVGPLIRVIGDRFPAPVKSSILTTFTILLTRVPLFTRPFFPQLQRTFVKCLSDISSLSVRNRAATALGVLMLHQPRIDPLITELTNAISTEEAEVRDSMANGLAGVIVSGGKNLSEDSKSAILNLLGEAFGETNKEPYNLAIARVAAAFALHDSMAIEPLGDYLYGETPATQLSSFTLREIIDTAPQAFYDLGCVEQVVTQVLANAAGTSPPSIARPARDARELLKEREPWASDEEVQSRL